MKYWLNYICPGTVHHKRLQSPIPSRGQRQQHYPRTPDRGSVLLWRRLPLLGHHRADQHLQGAAALGIGCLRASGCGAAQVCLPAPAGGLGSQHSSAPLAGAPSTAKPALLRRPAADAAASAQRSHPQPARSQAQDPLLLAAALT